MRPHKPLAILAATFATAAAVMTGCASDRTSHDPAKMGLYAADMERARVGCEARGGMLVPSGRNTGTAALDYPCRIHQATTIPPGK